MKIASFNIENIFHRDRELMTKPVSHSVTSWIRELEGLMNKGSRKGRDYIRMRELSFLLGFQKSAIDAYAIMRRKAGNLYVRRASLTQEYKASELSKWNGWIKINTEPINEVAIQNKARVIIEANPDILLLQEVEDRQSLVEFNQHFLPDGVRFTEIMVVSGNDSRGIDMGIMTKNGYKIRSIKSHVNDFFQGKKHFDKDFQEYEILTPKGETLWLMSAHLNETAADKFSSDEQRKIQAHLIAKAYNKSRAMGNRKVVIAGTLNAPSYCVSLSPLTRETNLKFLKNHPSYNLDIELGKDPGHYSLGAYRTQGSSKQRDHLLVSPELFKEIKSSGLNKKGIWSKRKDEYQVYPSLQIENHQASSHPLTWVKL